MTPETFTKKYEAALAIQDWQQLINSENGWQLLVEHLGSKANDA